MAKYFLVGVVLICHAAVAQQAPSTTDARRKSENKLRHLGFITCKVVLT